MTKNILILMLTFNFFTVFAHQDRIERPIAYQFIFQNQETVSLSTPSNSLVKSYSDDIINGKRNPQDIEITFKTGEKIIFRSDGKNWTEIKVIDDNKVMTVPETTIVKIPEIHFATVALIWNGSYERAFTTSYSYIRFDIGTVKNFSKYPKLGLYFSETIFSKAEIEQQVTENSTQWSDF